MEDKTPATSSKENTPQASPNRWDALIIPALAVFTGLLIGAFVIIVSDVTVIAAYQNFFNNPMAAFYATWDAISTAYGALFTGSFGDPTRISEG